MHVSHVADLSIRSPSPTLHHSHRLQPPLHIWHPQFQGTEMDGRLAAAPDVVRKGGTHRMREGFGSLREYPRYKINGR